MTIHRLRPPAVVPLELWDVLVDGEPLYLVDGVRQPAAIAHVARQLRAGEAVRHRGATPVAAVPFDEVVVAGGGAVDDVVRCLVAGGLSARAAQDPVWTGGRGGRAIANTRGATHPLVVDVGQTSIKQFSISGTVRIERDLALMPMELEVREAGPRARARAATVDFIARALACRPPPEVVVLALPCEIDDDLAVAGCSYPWDDGDPSVIGEVVRASGLPSSVPVLVLNDAELAAVAVDGSRGADTATLVLTLGLGLGAAWLPAAAANRARDDHGQR